MGADELVRVLYHVNEDLDLCLDLVQVRAVGGQQKFNILVASLVSVGQVETENIFLYNMQVVPKNAHALKLLELVKY